MTLVTLTETKDHLRIDGDDGDADLQTKIAAASAAVQSYLKEVSPYVLDGNGEPVLDGNGQPIVQPVVKAATLLLIGYLYRQRDEDSDNEFEPGYLPRPVTALLYPMRVPSCA